MPAPSVLHPVKPTDYFAEAVDEEFKMENWPCVHDKAKAALEQLIEDGTHIGHLLPVFTIDGERVPPSQYEKYLKGALVDVHCSITHQRWWASKGDDYYADIRSITVLNPPPLQRAVISSNKKHPLAISAHLRQFQGKSRKKIRL